MARPKTSFWISFFGFLTLFALPTIAQTQATETKPVPAEEAAPAPTAIPAPQIVQSATGVQELITEIRNALQDSTRFIPILESVPVTTAEMDTLMQSMSESLDRMRVRKVKTLEGEWMRYEAQLGGWSDYLDRELEKLSEWNRGIQERIDIWKLTWEQAEADTLPQTLLDRIGEVRSEIGSIEQEIKDRITLFLGLQTTIAELQSVVEANRVALRASADRASRWFTRDSAPLWGEGITEEGHLGDQISENRAQLRADLKTFWAQYEDKVYLNLAILVLLFIVLVTLNWRLKKWQVDEEFEKARYFLSRPLASALLLSLFASVFLYPNVPIAAAESIGLLLIVPFARLVPGLINPRLRKILIPAGVIFILHRLESVALEYTLLHRLILLVMDLTALGITIWVIRTGVHKTGKRSVWKFAAGLLPVAAILFGASIVGNVWGNMSLATLLSDATLSAVFLSFALWLIVRILDAVFLAALRTRFLRSLRSVQRHADVVHRRFMFWTELGIGAFWVIRVLEYYRLETTVWGWLTGAFNMAWTVGTFEISLGGIAVFFFAIWLSFQISKLIRFFLEEDILYRAGISTGVGQNVSMGVHYVIIGFGFLVALAAAGVELSKLTILFGALGVGIGFGLQNLVNNFVSGLILMFERPIQVGDTVQVGTLTGRVLRISIRSSTVKTFDGAEVIVPNGNLIAGELINWTRADRLRRVEIKVGVKYGSDPEQILGLLVDTARENEYVLEHPEPFGIFQAFGESSLDFSLFFWTSNYDRWWTTRSEVRVAVGRALKEAGIEIPFPQRDLHIKSGETSSVGPSD